MTQNGTHFQRNPDFIFRMIADEAVLVPIHNDLADMNCIYALNEVGAFIWSNLEQFSTQEDLHAAMLAEYAAEDEVITADLNRFLEEMVSIGAIRKVC